MLIPVQTFFSSLPGKSCNKCGQSMEEQADCYQNECNVCGDVYFYNLNGNRKVLGHAVVAGVGDEY